jgi:hypothetical protein
MSIGPKMAIQKVAGNLTARNAGGLSTKQIRNVESQLPSKIEFRTITLITTRYFAMCKVCGKEALLAGVPDTFSCTIPITKEQHDAIATHSFYISIPFAIECASGGSHIATGMDPNAKFVVQSKPGYRQGIWVDGESFEKTLLKYVPILMDLIGKGETTIGFNPMWREQIPEEGWGP